MPKKMIHSILSLMLVCAMAVSLSGCVSTVQAADLMDGVTANAVTGKDADDAFVCSQMRLAVELFQAAAAESEDENVLISPLSIQLALAMTANGAAGETRAEMEVLLGGGISLEELNEYLYTYVSGLPTGEKCKLRLANSIWFREDEGRLQVEQDFLQRNADYYGAQAYKEAFDDGTLKKINRWVDDHTDGMIDKILEKIDDDAVMYLLNALVFDAQWQTVYDASQVYKGSFQNIDGEERSVDMMHSEEMIYLHAADATGFVKPYQDGRYSFAALLPNEGIDIHAYISSLTSDGLLGMLRNAQSGMVIATMPKFSYAYELTMNDVLKELGMPSAFESAAADFSKMAHSSRGNIYIGDVLHKTFITVDELGTKAGAVTKVQMNDECAVMSDWVVNLSRPFVYMIVDNTTNLPIFIGTVMDIHTDI